MSISLLNMRSKTFRCFPEGSSTATGGPDPPQFYDEVTLIALCAGPKIEEAQ